MTAPLTELREQIEAIVEDAICEHRTVWGFPERNEVQGDYAFCKRNLDLTSNLA